MVKTTLQSTGAILLSLVAALFSVAGLEGLSTILHPWPTDFAGTSEEIAMQVETYPTWAVAGLGGVGWGGPRVVSAWLATRLGSNRKPIHGYFIGVILISAVIFNVSMLPYPTWFSLMNMVVLPTALYFGVRLGQARRDVPA
jgi:hypothetical protein